MTILLRKSSVRSAIFLALLMLCSCSTLLANHVKGGFIQYKYNGVGSTTGTSSYTITVTVFFSCTSNGPRDNVYIGVFNASTSARVAAQQVGYSGITSATKSYFNPCMSNPPSICYQIYTYVYTVSLPDIAAGYIIAVQDALRVSGIVNVSNSGSAGITLTAMIPGTINGVDYHQNTSPAFIFKDTAIVCYNGNFTYPFEATDVDGDSLSYSFGNGLNVSNPSQNTSSAAPGAPPYPSLTYTSGYSGTSPLGSGVTIDPVTGILSGKAPSTTGEYVVAVYVKEWRKGVLIDSIKKELQIYVYNCTLSAVDLNDSYINCDNFTFQFQNEIAATNITTYAWDFGVTNITTDVSAQPTPQYTYPAAGTYTVKLKVSNATGCSDSATSVVKVYPGFKPDFTTTGSCYQSPFVFNDATQAAYGTVNSWAWTFGETSSSANTATIKSPSHQYAAAGTYTVTLNVGSSVGCTGIATQSVTANNTPVITLPFTDTLICSIDDLPLLATASGTGATYSWTPVYNISNANIPNPVVTPKDTTTYTVTVTQFGCVGTANVTVNVLDFITVDLTADTTICLTDSITLTPVSHALKYVWTPSTALSDPTIKYPKAAPAADITYHVTANLGLCQDDASIHVKVVPYPEVDAGADSSICYGTEAYLHATMVANAFTWRPVATLSDGTSLTPVAKPLTSTNYILTVTDVLGCPKPVSDTVLVFVIDPVRLNAGKDTAGVVGQPLQLKVAANFTNLDYSWSPAAGLNNTQVQNPVLTVYNPSTNTYIVSAQTAEGCIGYDTIQVKIYKTLPDIFMPTAFSPNSNGRNELFRPILVGITKLQYFKIFNRWGQLVYSTSENGSGWDGTLGGKQQPTGTFVYMVQGVDYLGQVHTKKGAFQLIR